jgi:RNA polymerase sigma-70 factor (ECF subfamily)
MERMRPLVRVPGVETETAARPADQARHVRRWTDEPFETFYAGAADRVYRALAVTLADPQLAREATDEAMARAFARWRQVAACDNPGGWCFRVGLNWATSWRRKLRRERPMPDDDRVPPVPAPDAAAGGAVAALAHLPVSQRAVVVCRVLFNLSTAETASTLRIAEGTVRSRLSRAIAALRRELTEEEQ